MPDLGDDFDDDPPNDGDDSDGLPPDPGDGDLDDDLIPPGSPPESPDGGQPPNPDDGMPPAGDDGTETRPGAPPVPDF
tara:strand:- start:3236 stop:3469 length:234 start_codon:yes stop_codon:yes gene_type:complete